MKDIVEAALDPPPIHTPRPSTFINPIVSSGSALLVAGISPIGFLAVGAHSLATSNSTYCPLSFSALPLIGRSREGPAAHSSIHPRERSRRRGRVTSSF